MHDEPQPPYASRFPAGQSPHRPGRPGGISVEDVVALVDCASGADLAAIEALEAIAANLRRAADARAQLAAHVPPELLRQVLLARSAIQPATQPATQPAVGGGDDGLPS